MTSHFKHPQPKLQEATILEKESSFENSLVEFVQRHGRNLLIGLGILIALAFLFYRFSANQQTKAFVDYANVEVEMSRLKASSPAELSAPDGPLAKMQEILTRQPELHAKYDGVIAQTLLNAEDVTGAEKFATLALGRVKSDHLAFYNDYTEATLLLAQGLYDKAYARAENLKEKMLAQAQATQDHPEQRQFGNELFAFNLLRIAMIQQQLANAKGELAAWEEFLHYAQPPKGQEEKAPLIQPAAFHSLLSHMQFGQISLLDYINKRIKGPLAM